jgi:hypothetical protein
MNVHDYFTIIQSSLPGVYQTAGGGYHFSSNAITAVIWDRDLKVANCNGLKRGIVGKGIMTEGAKGKDYIRGTVFWHKSLYMICLVWHINSLHTDLDILLYDDGRLHIPSNITSSFIYARRVVVGLDLPLPTPELTEYFSHLTNDYYTMRNSKTVKLTL